MNLELTKLTTALVEKLEASMISLVTMLPNLLLSIIVFVLFWCAGRILRGWLDRWLKRFSEHQTLTRLATWVLFMTTVTLGLFVSLGILNLDKTVTSLLAGAGVIGLALGFAFQEIASNFLSGIFLAFEKPFREGDIVEAQGHLGVVKRINLRTTIIRKFDGIEVQIPNKIMFTDILSNYTSTPDRRVEVEVGVSYGEDLRKVTEIARSALEKVPHRIPEKDIEIFFVGFGDSSINFQGRVWVEYPGHLYFLQARHEAVIRIKEAFDQNGVTIPFPIRTLDFGIKGGVRMSQELEGRDHAAPPSEP